MFSTNKLLPGRTLPGVLISSCLLLFVTTNSYAETPVTELSAEETFVLTKLPSDIQQLESYLPELPGCNSESASLNQLGDTYYDFTPLTFEDSQPGISKTDTRQFTHLLNELEGQWVGEAAQVVCYASGRVRFHLYEVEELDFANTAAQRRFQSATRVLSEKRELAVIRVDRTRVASSEKNLSSGHIRNVRVSTLPQLSEVQHIEKLDEQHFRMRRIFRERAAGTGASILREREDWLQKNGNKLAWRTDWYTNGYFSGSEFSVLKRR